MTTEAFSEAGIAGVGSTGLTTQEPDDGRGVVPTLMSVLALIGALFLGQLAIGVVIVPLRANFHRPRRQLAR